MEMYTQDKRIAFEIREITHFFREVAVKEWGQQALGHAIGSMVVVSYHFRGDKWVVAGLHHPNTLARVLYLPP